MACFGPFSRVDELSGLLVAVVHLKGSSGGPGLARSPPRPGAALR